MDLPDDNRSWAEICDEELYEEEAELCEREAESYEKEAESYGKEAESYEKEAESYEKEAELYEKGVWGNFVNSDESLEEGEISDESFAVPAAKGVKKPELSNDLPWSTPLKEKPSSSANHENTDAVESIRNNLSYAKILSQGITTKEISKVPHNLPSDDLSLTSHLDTIHVDSPQKKVDHSEPILDILIDENTMFSPCKPTAPSKVTAPKHTKRPFMLIDSPARETRDRAFHFNKIAKSEVSSDVHSCANDGSPSSKREREVNPEVLCRRQKQIDYGKNTLGYERYSKLVPKNNRRSGDPKTPPKQLKMSRRAWDGLIKNWRMKLHKWDPISEENNLPNDNANSDQFSVSSEDPSSYDSSSMRSDSTVSTPKKCLSVAESEDGRHAWSSSREQIDRSNNSEKHWARRTRKSGKSENDDDDDYLGCEPLTENCVKACS